MIHVQNWKIYASHYSDDSTELGLELKKAQLHYKQYGEQMGVPVTEDIVCRAKRPSVDDIFPYLFEGTLIDDFNQAQFIERNNNCITIREWHARKGTFKQDTTASLPTTSGDEIITTGAATMPITTYADAGNVSAFMLQTGNADCADDLIQMTNNNAEETIGDVLNDIHRKDTMNNTPMKTKKLFEYETPSKPRNELLRFKKTHTFLSPTTKELQRSIDKAASSVKVIYNKNELKATRKNILQSVDHILSHDLVMENPDAAAFVTKLERKVQEIKEEFTKTVHSITGTRNGNDGELTYPSFKSRKQKHVDKRFKGLSG